MAEQTLSGIALRAATLADLPAIDRLLTASGLPVDGVAESLRSFVIAEAEGELVGVAGLEPGRENALLRSVAVDPAWRKVGVGRALVTRLIADAEGRGIHALYLLTTTAERYFPKLGFRRIPRDEAPDDIRATEEFRSVCCASATVMTRALD